MSPDSIRDYRAPPAHPRWEDLEAFATIYDGLQRGQTIAEVGQTTPAFAGRARLLYLRLARLERALGVLLVLRKKWSRKTCVTPDGERLYVHVQEIIRGRQRLEEAFSSSLPALRVATTASLLLYFFPQFVSGWRKRHRGGDLKLLFAEQPGWRGVQDAVARLDSDVGLVVQRPDDALHEAVRGEVLHRGRRTVLCSPRHPFATRGKLRPVSLAELRRETVVLQPEDARLFPPAAPSDGQRIVLPHFAQTRAHVQMGVGVCFGLTFFERLSPTLGIRAIPLEAPIVDAVVLLQSRSHPWSRGKAIDEFLNELRRAVRAVG